MVNNMKKTKKVVRLKAVKKVTPPAAPIRLDFGCGKRKLEGFIGIDIRQFDGVDIVMNAGADTWPWEDGTVEAIYGSHFIEHLTVKERIHFVNEAYRVLKPQGTLHLIAPHAFSARAYGDLTHQWPPISEWWPLYLDKQWRIDQGNAPHNDFYTCDFVGPSVFSMHPIIAAKAPEYQQEATTFFKEAVQDIIINLSARKG